VGGIKFVSPLAAALANEADCLYDPAAASGAACGVHTDFSALVCYRRGGLRMGVTVRCVRVHLR
jgi:hypothetical protein